MACDGERTKVSAEEILLLSIEVNTELLHILQCPEVRFTVFWLEVIVIVRYISYKVYLPTLARLP